ncbi:hypothetical protein MP638_005349 [Amoeboaphelidium occidentale]|nr:hypothetical protein MP638_005349 [Amoeboaphelidium occidentale]
MRKSDTESIITSKSDDSQTIRTVKPKAKKPKSSKAKQKELKDLLKLEQQLQKEWMMITKKNTKLNSGYENIELEYFLPEAFATPPQRIPQDSDSQTSGVAAADKTPEQAVDPNDTKHDDALFSGGSPEPNAVSEVDSMLSSPAQVDAEVMQPEQQKLQNKRVTRSSTNPMRYITGMTIAAAAKEYVNHSLMTDEEFANIYGLEGMKQDGNHNDDQFHNYDDNYGGDDEDRDNESIYFSASSSNSAIQGSKGEFYVVRENALQSSSKVKFNPEKYITTFDLRRPSKSVQDVIINTFTEFKEPKEEHNSESMLQQTQLEPKSSSLGSLFAEMLTWKSAASVVESDILAQQDVSEEKKDEIIKTLSETNEKALLKTFSWVPSSQEELNREGSSVRGILRSKRKRCESDGLESMELVTESETPAEKHRIKVRKLFLFQ